MRLLLAVGVIIWHSFAINGVSDEAWPLRQLLSGEGAVDAFFAISGFLIVRSWVNDPHVGRYLLSRVLRIFPAFWCSLVVTAIFIAPVFAGVFGWGNIKYVLVNAGLKVFEYDISGTPQGVPYPGVWNGSMWTLFWEFLCYLSVVVLGVVGALKLRHGIAVLFASTLVGRALVVSLDINNWWIDNGTRFALVFAAGAMIYRYVGKLPAGWFYTVAAFALSVIMSLVLPDYRLLGALPFAYAVISTGILLKHPSLRFNNDVSYGVYIYAFPVQQAIAIVAGETINIFVFIVLSVVITFVPATLSWFFVEKPMMRWKSTLARKYFPRKGKIS